jgi:hypothetical protein
MRAAVRAGTFVLGLVALAACAADAPSGPGPSQEAAMTTLQSMTEAALADAARRTGIKGTALKVLSAQAVTWPDGSLGCPQPGMMYTQALVPGFRVRIEAGEDALDYHAGRSGQLVLCPEGRATDPLPTDSQT